MLIFPPSSEAAKISRKARLPRGTPGLFRSNGILARLVASSYNFATVANNWVGSIMASQQKSVDIYYKHSNFFRTIHVDGCHGGIGPRGFIHWNVYSERHSIPEQSVFEVVGNTPGPERVVSMEEGVVREVEADLIMDLNTASAIYVWLSEKVDALRRMAGVSDEEWVANVESKLKGVR